MEVQSAISLWVSHDDWCQASFRCSFVNHLSSLVKCLASGIPCLVTLLKDSQGSGAAILTAVGHSSEATHGRTSQGKRHIREGLGESRRRLPTSSSCGGGRTKYASSTSEMQPQHAVFLPREGSLRL